jgi:AcrR family transcriptional regulator
MLDVEQSTRTTGSSERPTRYRSGGRSERVRHDVAEAVLALMREGRVGFSVAEVAERAGVHRTTVYRWWPTPADLVREALTIHTARLVVPDTGKWEDDIRALAFQLADFFSDPVEMAMNVTMAGGTQPDVDMVVIEHWMPVFREFARVVERAALRGEVRPDTDATVVLQLLVSPLLMHTVLLRSEPGQGLVRDLADAVSRAFSSGKTSVGRA